MRKMIVRLLVISLLVLSASVTLAQDEPTEIKFLHIFSGLGSDQMSAAVESFNASQDRIVVTAETAQGSYEGILERLQLGTMANDLPDVTLTGLTYTQFAIENLPLIPVQRFIDAEGFDLSGYFPQLLDLGRDNQGELFGMPFLISNPVVFYNATLFEAAGLEVPTTMEAVRETALALTDPAAEQYGVFFDFTVTGNWIFQALVETFGGTMLDNDGRAAFDSEAGRAALQYLADLVQVDASMPNSNGQQAIQLFLGGKLAMLVTSSAATGFLVNTAGFEVGVAEFPTEAGNRTIPAGGNNLVIIESGDSVREQAAWEFIKYMTSPEVNGPLANSIGYMTVSQSATETADILGDRLASDVRYQVPYNQLPDTVPWYNMGGDIGSRVYAIVQTNIEAVLNGQKSVEQALTDAQAEINARL